MRWLRQFNYRRQQGWSIIEAFRITNWAITKETNNGDS